MASNKTLVALRRIVGLLSWVAFYDFSIAYPKSMASYEMVPSPDSTQSKTDHISSYNAADFLKLPKGKNTTNDKTYDYPDSFRQVSDSDRHQLFDQSKSRNIFFHHGQSIKKRGHRIENPCAGKTEHFLGVAPTVATISVTPGEILGTLGGEASKARRTTAAILRRYADIGVNGVSLDLQLNNLITFSLSNGQAPSGNLISIPAMLKDAYRELSRAAIVLEKIVMDDNQVFRHLLEDLKENGIYSILCGLKVVMEAQNISFSAGQIGQDAGLPTVNSHAERFVRDCVVVGRIDSLLNDIGSQFSTLAAYL